MTQHNLLTEENNTLVSKSTEVSNGSTVEWVPVTGKRRKDWWSFNDVKGYANKYDGFLKKGHTETRHVKSTFFNYIKDNWERLNQGGIVRVKPSEAFQWFEDRDDSIFLKRESL